MKKLIMMVMLVMLAGSVQADVFCGRFSGNDEGKWSIYYDDTSPGNSFAIAWSTRFQAIDFGTVIRDTDEVVAMFDTGVIFRGDYEEPSGDIDGFWENGYLSGVVEGETVQIADIADYVGEYTLYSTGGDTIQLTIYNDGYIFASIETEGRVSSGRGVVDMDGRVFCEIGNTGIYGTTQSGFVYNVMSKGLTTYSINNSNSNSNTNTEYVPIALDDEDSGGCFIGNLK